MFGKQQIPPTQQLGYKIADVDGGPVPYRWDVDGLMRPVPLPNDPSVPVYMFLPQTGYGPFGFAMRGQKEVFLTDDVTPMVYQSFHIPPITERRYTVLPTPQLGLDAVTLFNDNG